MKIIEAIIKKGEWLLDALKRIGYDMIPTNTILDKTLTGIGATSCEIRAKRNSIIIEPNVPVILCKLENEEVIIEAVYAKVKPYPIIKFLQRNDIPYKKILTTPESFHKIRTDAQKIGINIYGDDWFCLFDECEKITQDHDYRRTISQPIYDFFQFKNKAFVSATPLHIPHSEFERQNFQKIKIVPDYDYKKDLQLIVTNSFIRQLRNKIAELEDSPCVCIFINKTDAINAIIDELNLKDYKIFCSEKSVKKLIERGINKAYSEIQYPFAKYNFFTCRFYSGLDISLYPTKPDIIMLTDLRVANYTMIDPLTEAIQIQGRFRKEGDDEQTYRTLTHIATVNPNMEVMTDKALENYLAQSANTYWKTKKDLERTEDENKRKSLIRDLNNMGYKELLDDRGEVNPFSISNRYNEERVKSYYISGNALLQAYLSTNHFNVDYIEDLQTIGEDDILRFNRIQNDKELRRQIVHALEQLRNDYKSRQIGRETARLYIKLLKRFDETNYILPIYKKIGLDGIEKCNYNKTLLNKAIKQFDKEQAEIVRFNPHILKAIQDEFELDVYLPKTNIQNRLKRIFKQYGINYKVTQSTIEDYYDTNESNSKQQPSYKLNHYKFDGRIFDAPP